ncbi:MAG: 1-(5-phosphoribosyl)-5-[(5-phosphoribosylamino)methylideneamino] imidazole-4-carboxamide isomerase [Reichenbachiella sp.]
MKLVPSIVIHHGKVKRSVKGDSAKGKNHNDNPIELARQFEDAGVRLVHIVDLDGARKGRPMNDHVVEFIRGHTDLDINFSGGVHTDGDISKVFENGATSVTCSTMAVYEPDNFSSWIMSYGNEKIVLGADALDDMIRIGGWLKETKIKLMDHIAHFHERGLKYLKTTDISKDGALNGPSLELYKNIKTEFPEINLFASGGIRNMEDIAALDNIGVRGVIFGKAFYEGRITLKEIELFHSKK